MVVSIEGAEEGSPVVVVAVAVGKMPMLTLSFISITSTFTSSLLSLGEPCLERRPGFGFGLLPMNLRHQKKMFSQLGVLRGSVRFLFCLKKKGGGTHETNVGSSIDPDAVSLSLSVFSSLTERKLSSPPADA